MKLFVSRIVALVTLFGTACSEIFVTQVPKDWNRVDRPSCTSTYEAVASDGLFAGISAVMTYGALTLERENDTNPAEFLWVMAIPGVLFLASGVKGYFDVNECRRAQRSVVAP